MPLNYGHAARPPRWSLWRFRLLILLINQRVGRYHIRQAPILTSCCARSRLLCLHIRTCTYTSCQNEGNSKITSVTFRSKRSFQKKKDTQPIRHDLLCPCLPDHRRHRSVISTSVPCPVAGPGRRHDRRIFRIFECIERCRRRWIDG